MENSNCQKTITFSKPQVRGDEVGTLFFAITILFLLIISVLRFSVIGKVLDDFCFSFLFGWMKYLIYGFSLLAIVPLCFGYHLKMKLAIFGKILLVLILCCWTTQTISLMINNVNDLYTNYFHLNLINITNNYFNMWWTNSVITNYNGFFGSPISFANFSINTFFPQYATGGMISTILTGLFSYGFFVTNVFTNISAVLLLVCYFLFKRPLIIFSKFKLFVIIVMKKVKLIKHQNKNKKFTKKQLKAEKLVYEQNRKQILAEKIAIEKEVLKEIKDMKKQTKNNSQFNISVKRDNTIKLKQQQILEQQKKQKNFKSLNSQPITTSEVIKQQSESYFNEDSHLTPFGKINPDKQKDNINDNKGILVVKKSLEESIINNKPIIINQENNPDSENS